MEQETDSRRVGSWAFRYPQDITHREARDHLRDACTAGGVAHNVEIDLDRNDYFEISCSEADLSLIALDLPWQLQRVA